MSSLIIQVKQFKVNHHSYTISAVHVFPQIRRYFSDIENCISVNRTFALGLVVGFFEDPEYGLQLQVSKSKQFITLWVNNKKIAYGGRSCKKCIQVNYYRNTNERSILHKMMKTLLCNRNCQRNSSCLRWLIKASQYFKKSLTIHNYTSKSKCLRFGMQNNNPIRCTAQDAAQIMIFTNIQSNPQLMSNRVRVISVFYNAQPTISSFKGVIRNQRNKYQSLANRKFCFLGTFTRQI